MARCMSDCRRHMSKLSKLKSRYARAVRKGDDDAQWELDGQLEKLEREYQKTAYRLNEILEELEEEGASERAIREFINETRMNCTF